MARYLAATLPLAFALAAAPGLAKDSLGVFGQWGAFRDPQVPRCYAIAAAEPNARSRERAGFASIATWPARQIRGQLFIRMSRTPAQGARVSLAVGKERFVLTGNGGDVWAAGPQEDAAILTAMRAAASMTVSARDTRGNRFADRYSLNGAATAMDAASVGCARARR
ncbi:invasion associated locus B family protein [Aurantiacibacter spongiae]|uniref:Invasion associated locus B family protein n=1 Tax=Aurantiacibacter spongiae TaxID=2488860 RepID=A0A3N5D7W3_9SPHN|nr:hypothetical protein [Aurantiacibacter spongiae]RPF70668.1 hypothetical protein EG799_02785 [Aurantiacibacter spongiae]